MVTREAVSRQRINGHARKSWQPCGIVSTPTLAPYWPQMETTDPFPKLALPSPPTSIYAAGWHSLMLWMYWQDIAVTAIERFKTPRHLYGPMVQVGCVGTKARYFKQFKLSIHKEWGTGKNKPRYLVVSTVPGMGRIRVKKKNRRNSNTFFTLVHQNSKQIDACSI